MIPPREEAVEVAEMNIEQDANKYFRLIEASLMLWDGVAEVKIDVPKNDAHLCEYLMTALKINGYTARYVKKSGTSQDYSVYFK